MASVTVRLGPPAKCSEGSTRVPRSRGKEEILAFQGSASPIVPMPGSWDIDDPEGRNVRGAQQSQLAAYFSPNLFILNSLRIFRTFAEKRTGGSSVFAPF